MARIGSIAVVTALLAMASPAAASVQATDFTKPVSLGQAGQPPSVVMGPDGSATLVWSSTFWGVSGATTTSVAQISPVTGLRWKVDLPLYIPLTQTLARNDAGTIAIGVAGRAGGGGAVVVGHDDGRFGAPEEVPIDDPAGFSSDGTVPPAVAVTPDGTVVALYDNATNGAARILAAWRTPDGTWSGPQVLPLRSQTTPQLIADGQGGVHAVLMDGWKAGNQIVATDWHPGTGFGPLTPLGGPAPYEWDGGSLPAIAADRRGDVVAAWSPSDTPPDGAGPMTFYDSVEVAERSAGGEWRPAHLISEPTGGRQQNPVVALNDAGAAIVTWQADGIGSAFRPADGSFEAPAIRRGALGWQQRLPTALDALGNAVTLRTTASDPSAHVVAALRPRTGPFGDDVDLYSDGHVQLGPVIAADPYGNGVAAWMAQRPAMTPPPEGPPLLMVSTYSARPPQVTQAKAARRAFHLRVDEPARVTVKLRNHHGRSVKLTGVAKPRRVTLLRYTTAARRLLRRPGRYRATVTARDRGPQRPKAVRVSFRRR